MGKSQWKKQKKKLVYLFKKLIILSVVNYKAVAA